MSKHSYSSKSIHNDSNTEIIQIFISNGVDKNLAGGGEHF